MTTKTAKRALRAHELIAQLQALEGEMDRRRR